MWGQMTLNLSKKNIERPPPKKNKRTKTTRNRETLKRNQNQDVTEFCHLSSHKGRTTCEKHKLFLQAFQVQNPRDPLKKPCFPACSLKKANTDWNVLPGKKRSRENIIVSPFHWMRKHENTILCLWMYRNRKHNFRNHKTQKLQMKPTKHLLLQSFQCHNFRSALRLLKYRFLQRIPRVTLKIRCL